MNWADAIGVVAAALAAQRFGVGGEPSGSPSLLAALTSSAPPDLQRRLQREHAAQGAVTGAVEPLIYQNELPVRLLAYGIIGSAAQAMASQPDTGESAASDPRVVAIVALAALSTLRLAQADPAALLIQVHRAGRVFDEAGWASALDSLARRTAQLNELLWQAAGDRRQTWRQVTLEDRILAEAVAAAVVGGVASAAGLPAQQWTFPFHLFCSLAVSAAKLSLTTIERWLGIEFLPAPLTPERTASLAVLIAGEASALEQGCRCKEEADGDEAAFTRRGPCRQADHDLRDGSRDSRNPAAVPGRGTPARCGDGSAAGSAARRPGGPLRTGIQSGCGCVPTMWPAASWPADGCPATGAWAVRSCSTTASCRSSAWPAGAKSSWPPVPTRPGGRSSGGRSAAHSSNWSTAVNSVGAAPGPCSSPSLASSPPGRLKKKAGPVTPARRHSDHCGYAAVRDVTRCRSGIAPAPSAERMGNAHSGRRITDGYCCPGRMRGLT